MVGMRKRSLSVFVSKGDNRLSRKFEGVASDNDGHSDSEMEDDIPSKKLTHEDDEGLAENWTKTEYEELVEQLKQSLPTKDIRKFTTSLQLMKWDKIHVKQHGPEEVKRVTHLLISKVRRFRTLGEMLGDIPEVVQKIISAEKPKPPLSAYNLFLQENIPLWREQHKEMQGKDMFKFGSKAFAELSDKKKWKYEAMAAGLKSEYKETLAKFYEEHPDLAPQKNTKSRVGRVRNRATEKTKTPFNLFYESRQDVSANISQQQARKEWDMLTMKKKIPFIKASFEAQTGGKLLNKKEQEMLDRYHGKPAFIGRNVFEYFMRTRGADTDATNLSGTERIKKHREEYKKLSDREALELKMDYYKARDNYISEYQAYIENLPEQKRQVEIEYLQSLTDKSSKGKKPSSTAEKAPKDEELYPGSAEEDPPVAESTTIKKPAKDKKTSRKKELPVEEEHEEEDEEHLDSSPSKKRKINDNSTPKKLIPKVEDIKTGKKKSSNKKNKADYSNDETRSIASSAGKSGSILKGEPKKRLSPEKNQQQEEKKTKKNTQETPVAKPPPKEPEKPPKVIEEFYRQRLYKGKVGKHKESFANLSAAKKREIVQQMKDAQKQYIVDFERFLKSLPKDEIKRYIQKINAERQNQATTEGESDDEEGEEDDNESSEDVEEDDE